MVENEAELGATRGLDLVDQVADVLKRLVLQVGEFLDLVIEHD